MKYERRLTIIARPEPSASLNQGRLAARQSEVTPFHYLALIVAVQTAQVGVLTLSLAWAFVALRVLHSAIHCTYNKVIHRFYVYFAGGVMLWVLWAVLAIGLL